jgi:hypothetical protein
MMPSEQLIKCHIYILMLNAAGNICYTLQGKDLTGQPDIFAVVLILYAACLYVV